MAKWVLVVNFLVIAILVAFGIFVATGVIDGPALFWRVGMKTAWLQPHLETYGHGQDAENWIAGKEIEIQERLAELEAERIKLAKEEEALIQRTHELDKRQSDLEQASANLNTAQRQKQSVETLAEIYTEMSAEESAKILEKLENSLVLQILLAMEVQDAAEILTKLPTNLAVTLSEELGQASP